MQVCGIVSLGIQGSLSAQDASIDKLLSKLPPPEKIIKPSARKALEQPDPAFKDPFVTQNSCRTEHAEFSAGIGSVAQTD